MGCRGKTANCMLIVAYIDPLKRVTISKVFSHWASLANLFFGADSQRSSLNATLYYKRVLLAPLIETGVQRA